MKTVKANLLRDVVTVYDQNKTTIQGRAFVKTVDGGSAVGPSLNKFVDPFTDSTTSFVPALSYLSPNGRMFHINAEAGGIASITCHTMDFATGQVTYRGLIRMQLPDNATTTHTYRGLKAVDEGVTGWRIFVVTTGSVAINGGVFCVNNVDLADFGIAPGTLFPFATGLNQKATYFLQDPAAIGAGQLNIASGGITIDRPNNRAYVHNGVAATHQYYVYSTSTSLDCPLSAGAIDQATERITINAHGYNNNDPIFLTNLVGGAGLTNNTQYFVRNPTANDFQLSTTSGGTVINITTNGTADFCRAFGTTGSAWVHKTGNLPALAGTLVISDSEDYAVPGHTTNAGQPCIFFCTSTNLYLGRISELTSGATAWPSLVTSNILGAPNQIVTPALSIATWSNVLDRAVYLTQSNILIMKQVVNNQIDKIFGGSNNKFREGFTSEVVELGLISAIALDIEDGWCILTSLSTTTGQRGTILTDLRSDELFDHSYIVTPVLSTPDAQYKFLASTDKLFEFTGGLRVQYRTSGFGSISGGWVDIPFAEDISGVSSGDQVQFKILFDTLGLDTCIPAQLTEFFLGYESLFAVSDNWEVSRDLSSNLTPSRVAFRLKQAYGTSVPQLFFRAYDLSSNLLTTANTVANAGNFEYSTDNGVSWLPLGTIPNTVGTLIRFTFTTPPGVDIRPSLLEE